MALVRALLGDLTVLPAGLERFIKHLSDLGDNMPRACVQSLSTTRGNSGTAQMSGGTGNVAWNGDETEEDQSLTVCGYALALEGAGKLTHYQ
jgi:hypothetical protein